MKENESQLTAKKVAQRMEDWKSTAERKVRQRAKTLQRARKSTTEKEKVQLRGRSAEEVRLTSIVVQR